MFLEGLDELDQKIIQILIGNARISYSEIGEKIGISRVAVKARISALEQRGIIEEYTTIINPQKISGAVSCYFEIETQPDTFLQAVEILNENETITQIYRVTGKNRPACPRSCFLQRRDGSPDPAGHRPSARTPFLQLQHHPFQDQRYQRTAVINLLQTKNNSGQRPQNFN